jgi:hypothetical protein
MSCFILIIKQDKDIRIEDKEKGGVKTALAILICHQDVFKDQLEIFSV